MTTKVETDRDSECEAWGVEQRSQGLRKTYRISENWSAEKEEPLICFSSENSETVHGSFITVSDTGGQATSASA